MIAQLVNNAMQGAPHDNRLYRQARAAIAAVRKHDLAALWTAYTAATNAARAKARAEGRNDVDAAYEALRDQRATQLYNTYWSLHTIALETP